MSFIDQLYYMDACTPALQWLQKGGFETPQAAWDVCEHGEWMIWVLWKQSVHGSETYFEALNVCLDLVEMVRHLLPLRRAEYALDMARTIIEGTQEDRDALEHEAVALIRELRDAPIHGAYPVAIVKTVGLVADLLHTALWSNGRYLCIELHIVEVVAEILEGYTIPTAVTYSKCADSVRRHIPHPPTLPPVEEWDEED